MRSPSLQAVRAAARITSFVLVLVLLAAPGFGQRAVSSSRAGGIPIHYEKADLKTIVDAVARATGRRFVYGDDLRGRVTITVPGRVTPEEAFELLLAALHTVGFTALPLDEDTLRLVPVQETKSGAPLVGEAADPRGERPISTLVELREISAEEAVVALEPYVSKEGVALAYPPTNSLILAGTEGELLRLVAIARILDESAGEDLLVRTIRYRSASLIAEAVDTVFNSTPVAAHRVEIWTDDRTNQLVVRGHVAVLGEIRAFLEGFDLPVEGEGLVRVVRVLNRDAEEMAELLRNMAAPAQPAAIGRAAQAVGPGNALAGREFHVEVDVPTQSLLIRSDPETFGILAQALADLDRLPPRVSVEVLVFEVTRPYGFKLGFNYQLLSATAADAPVVVAAQSVTGAASGPTGDAIGYGQYTRAPVAITVDTPAGPVVFRPPSEDISFQAGERLVENNILLRPNIVGVSGEEHEIFSGDNIPIPAASTSTATAEDGTPIQGSPLNVTQNIERVDVGTRLRIKPTLGEESIVRLELDLEVSQLTESRSGPVEEVGPSYANRDIEATLELRPGETAVIGATGATVSSERRIGIPFLMNIPFIGWLFTTLEQRTDETDLIAVVEARVLRDADDAAAETIRRRLAFERAISRTADLNSIGPEPFAVLLETTRSEADAKVIARAFASDGFETRVTEWEAHGNAVWDVYLSDLASFEEAGRLARRLSEAGWSPEIAVLSPLNELAGD